MQNLQKYVLVISRQCCGVSMGTHCECGICGHFEEKDCIEKNCKCCSNFHIRSGSNANEK